MSKLINEGEKKALIWGLGAFWALILAIFIMGGVSLTMYAVFGTAEEEIRHNIHKRSTSHIEGSIRTIQRYQIQYLKAKGAEKVAIRDMILRELQNIQDSDLPDHLRSFATEIRREAI